MPRDTVRRERRLDERLQGDEPAVGRAGQQNSRAPGTDGLPGEAASNQMRVV